MKKRLTYTMLACLSLMIASSVQAQKPYVIDSEGRKIEGDAIQASEKGVVKLKIGAGVRTFAPDEYRLAFSPKPTDVARLESMLEQENYDIILERGKAIFDKYKYLGWAGRITYLRAQAHLAKNQPEQALQLVESAEPFVKLNEVQVRIARVNALLQLDRNDEAEELLAELKKAESDQVAAFAFNAAGDLLAKRGQKKDAVLEYLKTVLVIDSEVAPEAQKAARERVVELLKEMGDQRYEKFQ